MGEPALRAMTADEFLAWDDGTDTRHELVDGEIVAMAPPTDAHGTIAVNVGVEIADRLRARAPCRAIGEAGIRLDDATISRPTSPPPARSRATASMSRSRSSSSR